MIPRTPTKGSTERTPVATMLRQGTLLRQVHTLLRKDILLHLGNIPPLVGILNLEGIRRRMVDTLWEGTLHLDIHNNLATHQLVIPVMPHPCRFSLMVTVLCTEEAMAQAALATAR